MKVCITADGPDLDSEVGQDLGHSPYFLIVDLDTMEYESMENEGASWDMGAGMKAADIVINAGVDAVITGRIGPHGYSSFSDAGIMVSSDEEGGVREAIESFKRRHMEK